jgi:protein TonB
MAAAATGPVRVGGNVREPRVVRVVPPVFPKLALQARVTGTVVLEAIVNEKGLVEQIKVVSGHPLLVEAAIDAVKQWEYEPTQLDGVPTAVILTAEVTFQIQPVS